MMDYKSPIEITIGQFRWEQEKRIEGEVFSAIQEVGINVDREELVKALQYDRDQYRKGYEDGVRANADTVRKMQERLKEQAEKIGFPYDDVVVSVRTIDQIAKEMLEEEK